MKLVNNFSQKLLLSGNIFKKRMLAGVYPPRMRKKAKHQDKSRDIHHYPARRPFYFFLTRNKPREPIYTKDTKYRKQKERHYPTDRMNQIGRASCRERV